MKRRSLIVSECSIETNNENVPRMVIAKNPKLQKVLRNVDVEGAKKEAREILMKTRKKIRSININTDGNVHAVILKGKAPDRSEIPGWRFKRPGVVGVKQ